MDSFQKRIDEMNSPIDIQKKFYDEYWSSLAPFSSYKLHRISEIIKILNYCRGKLRREGPIDILDLGCGDGRSVAVWQIAGNACGLDLSEKAITAAKEMFPKLKFYSGNGLESPFGDQSFDVIVSQEVIEHIEIQQKYIDECYRILRNNGYLIMTTPNKFYFDRRKGGNYSNQPIENLLTPNEVRKLLSSRFEIIKHYTIIPAPGHYGVYRILDNRWFKGGIYKAGLGWLHEIIKNKLMLSLNQIVLAKKRNSSTT